MGLSKKPLKRVQPGRRKGGGGRGAVGGGGGGVCYWNERGRGDLERMPGKGGGGGGTWERGTGGRWVEERGI